jgi:hypothetical protein
VLSRSRPTFQKCVLPPSSGLWSQYSPLKRRSTPPRLHGATSQKTPNFSFIETANGECLLATLSELVSSIGRKVTSRSS